MLIVHTHSVSAVYYYSMMLFPCIIYHRTSAPNQKKFKSSSTKEKETTKQLASKRVLVGIKAAIGLVFLIAVLASAVLSKLTLVTLTDQLRATNDDKTRITFYWYIQLILLIPSFITFVRCFVVGVIGKTTKSFPWPTGKAILYVRLSMLSVIFCS